MRIVCPNCEAQYEVPDDVMPIDGRDVQCSNCSETWFQHHPDAPEDETGDRGKAAGQADEDAAPSDTGKKGEAKAKPNPVPPPIVGFEPAPAPKPPADGSGPKRRQLDPDVADVLRTEAELEKQARRKQGSEILESQPDLGLQDAEPSKRTEQESKVLSKQRDDQGAEDTATALADDGIPTSRRDHLPDIEQINSTLRSNSSRSPDGDAGQTGQIEAQEARSSRTGFSLVLLLVAVLVLVYVFAEPLAETVPQLQPMLQSYVAIVDSWRLWLNQKIDGALTWLDAAAIASKQ
jgi:predicted Zn finger-like uncharacterized protein